MDRPPNLIRNVHDLLRTRSMHPCATSDVRSVDGRDGLTIEKNIGICCLGGEDDGDDVTAVDRRRCGRVATIACYQKDLSFILLVSCCNGNGSASVVFGRKIPHAIVANTSAKARFGNFCCFVVGIKRCAFGVPFPFSLPFPAHILRVFIQAPPSSIRRRI